jgi:hypothetical protein
MVLEGRDNLVWVKYMEIRINNRSSRRSIHTRFNAGLNYLLQKRKKALDGRKPYLNTSQTQPLDANAQFQTLDFMK